MASWTLSNGTNDITIVTSLTTFDVSKFARISMTVVEPVLYFNYSDNNPELVALRSGNKKKNKVNTRRLEIDFNDVVSPVVASATALEVIINGWLATSGGGVATNDYGNNFLLMGG